MTVVGFLGRLEPRSRGESLAPGLAARAHDPLWLLSRQWAVGELDGDSGGTLVEARIRARGYRLTNYVPRPGSALPYDPASSPLDVLVEAEPTRTARGWTARRRIDVGRELVRCLRERGAGAHVPAFVAQFALVPAGATVRATDPRGSSLLDVAAGRLPDGEKLFLGLVPDLRRNQLPATPAIPAAERQAVLDAALDWLAGLQATVVEPPTGVDAWDQRRLEHDLRVEARTPLATDRLVADGYRGGELEWYAFDVEAPAQGDPSAPQPEVFDVTVLPTPIRFLGMPAARWWELEDGQVDLGAVDAAPSDLARLALLEFALLYGNDFFAAPLQLPVGRLARLDALVCTDSFGARILIRPATSAAARAAGERWTMFTLTAPANSVADVLFLTPGTAGRIEGQPLEEVQLLRDEMANLAWAVEHSVEGAGGVAVPRAEEDALLAPDPGPPPPAGTPLRYRLGTSVPRHWFPLIPVDEAGALAFEVRRMGDAGPEPRGRLLPPLGRRIDERELPREGLRLTRRPAMARWTNGSSFAWIRRERRVGRGEGSSGLRFDVAEPDGGSGT